ncbi:MAG TPA: 2-phospho-L-lactate transferase [Candidatus Binatia bacterium]|nr:2-phospho-L-lactate transferase [Candidatus Binatia bacterium]
MTRLLPGKVAVLAGGVGAARLLRGLAPLVRDGDLTVVVNTADDDVFFGLHVSPDVDTVLYTLAGLADPIRGWGIAGDTFAGLHALGRYYDETWFQLGDRDLATHVFRTERLRAGATLSEVTAEQAQRLGVRARVLPMSDDPVRTIVETSGGRRSFQEYLVRDRARETVRSITYSRARGAHPAPGVRAAIEEAAVVLIAPSNPLVSVGPILAVPGIRQSLRRTGAPVVAVSPLIAGRPVKGPADRMMRALGISATPLGLAECYGDFLDGLVIDGADRAYVPRLRARGVASACLDILMRSQVRAAVVARAALRLAAGAERRRRLAG